MQPYEAADPIEARIEALVPWIAYSPGRESTRAPIGLAGSPASITSGSQGRSRLTERGGDQAT